MSTDRNLPSYPRRPSSRFNQLVRRTAGERFTIGGRTWLVLAISHDGRSMFVRRVVVAVRRSFADGRSFGERRDVGVEQWDARGKVMGRTYFP